MKLNHAVPLMFLGLVLLPSTSHGLGIVAVSKKTCLEVQTTKFPVRLLNSYIKQTIPMEAIMFFTIKNKVHCADPTMDWVKKAIAVLDKRAQNQPIKTQATNKNTTKKPTGGNKKRPTKSAKGKQKKQQNKRVTPQIANKTIVTTRTPSVLR